MNTLGRKEVEAEGAMDDDAYGRALLEELDQLAQDLLQARSERDASRESMQASEAELGGLRSQLQQRKQNIDSLTETDILKKKVDARKREKAQLLKQLATMHREHGQLEQAAGLASSAGPVGNQHSDAQYEDCEEDETCNNGSSPVEENALVKDAQNRPSCQRRPLQNASGGDDLSSRRSGTCRISRSQSLSRRQSRTGHRNISFTAGSGANRTETTVSPSNRDLIEASKPRRRPMRTTQQPEAEDTGEVVKIKHRKEYACRKDNGRSCSTEEMPTLGGTYHTRQHTQKATLTSRAGSRASFKPATHLATSNVLYEQNAAAGEKAALHKYPRSPIPNKAAIGYEEKISLFASMDDDGERALDA